MFKFLTKKTLWNEIAVLSISVFCYFVALGILTVSLPVILNENGVSKTLIGVSDNIKIISGLLALLIIPKIAHNLGIVKTGIVSLILYGFSILLLPLYQNYTLWLVFISIFGIGFVVFRTMEETLANVLASNKNRCDVMGITSTAMLSGIALGPVITRYVGVTNYWSFVIAFILVVISIVFFSLLKGTDAKIKSSEKTQVWKFIKEQPVVFLSKFTLEFFIQAIFLFLVLYSIMEGHSAETAGLFIAYFSLSGIFNYVTGELVNKVQNRYITMILGVLFMFAMIEILPWAIKVRQFTNALFFLFGLLGCSVVFLSTLSILNSHYDKEDLVAANSALTIFDSIGMILAGLLTGLAIDRFGIFGFYIPMACLALFYIVFIVIMILAGKIDFKKSHKDVEVNKVIAPNKTSKVV